MDVLKKEKLERLLRYGLVFAIVFFCVLLLPQVRNFIIEIGEKIQGQGLNYEHWMKIMIGYPVCAIYFLIVLLIFSFISKNISTLRNILLIGAIIYIINIILLLVNDFELFGFTWIILAAYGVLCCLTDYGKCFDGSAKVSETEIQKDTQQRQA